MGCSMLGWLCRAFTAGVRQKKISRINSSSQDFLDLSRSLDMVADSPFLGHWKDTSCLTKKGSGASKLMFGIGLRHYT